MKERLKEYSLFVDLWQYHLQHRLVSQHWCDCNGGTPGEVVLFLSCVAPAAKHPLWPATRSNSAA
jgi:hypothetical protein